jgi:hypothetical protein
VSKVKAKPNKAKGQTGSGAQNEAHPQGRSFLSVPQPGPTPEGTHSHRQIPDKTVFGETGSAPNSYNRN